MRGVALDEAIGREPFPAMLLRLWRGDPATDDEAALLGACLVASIDHGPLSPSALVTRTIASTRAAADERAWPAGSSPSASCTAPW